MNHGYRALRLDVAAALAFPDGSISAGALRGESMKGTLAVERIAGKLYTPLKAIEEMRERCRVQPSAPAPRGETPLVGHPRRGLDRPRRWTTVSPLVSAFMIVQELKERSRNNKPR